MKLNIAILIILSLWALSLRAQDTSAIHPYLPDSGIRIRGVCNCNCHHHPVNDYPGLNSLRKRLANPFWNGKLPAINTGLKLEDGYIKPLFNPRVMSDSLVTGPVYVFFPISGFRLLNPEQIININSIANLAVSQSLRVRITGAADSATGSPEKNEALAQARACHVAELFKERGVPENRIEIQSEGGIAVFEPASANRNCRIELFSNPQ